jgi:hypothetical protein
MNNMKEIDETREVKVVQCPTGHLYPGNVHKTCPYCIKEAEEIANREALKKSDEREFHINTRQENFKIWFNNVTAGLRYLFDIIFELLEKLPREPRKAWRDPHFFDLYR